MSHKNFSTGQPCHCGFGKHQPPASKFHTDLQQHIKGKRRHKAESVWKMLQRRSAADPEWLQQWMDKNGPYLYHGTTHDAAKKIMEEGLYPHDHPRPGEEGLFEDPSRSQWADDFYRPRPGHVYLGTQEYVKDAGYGEPMGKRNAMLQVDLRKLDPKNINGDEDHWQNMNATQWHPAVKSVLADNPPPSQEYYFGAKDWNVTLGDWADDANLGQDPAETHYSMEKGSIAHNGVIPPEAISLATPHVFSKTDAKPWVKKMWHGSHHGLLGKVETPFWTSSHQPEAQISGTTLHPVQVCFRNPAFYFNQIDHEAIDRAKADGNDGIIVHHPESEAGPKRQWAIALDPGAVVPGHDHEFPY